ncbi:MAG: hypothetical protein ACE5KL_02795 [Alphaproteobacteria bacterium]
MTPRRDSGMVTFIVAKIVCCGLLILAAAGALSGVTAWLFDGRRASLVFAALVAVGTGVVFWWQRQRARRRGIEAGPAEG